MEVIMALQKALLNWNQLSELTQNMLSNRYEQKAEQLSSSALIPNHSQKRTSETSLPVLLYCNVNTWHPFCNQVWFALEEKGIPFMTEFIDLKYERQLHTDLIPLKTMPVAQIDGELVCGSKDIVLALEKRFPELPLLPTDPLENAIARQLVEDAEADGTCKIGYNLLMRSLPDDSQLASLQASFEAKLDELEQLLSDSLSCYFLDKFSLADIMYASHLDRLAESLPVYRNYHIKGNPRFPNLNNWFIALSERSAYRHIQANTTTFNLMLSRIWGLDIFTNNALPIDSILSETDRYRAEAIEWLSHNREATISDIFKNSGAFALAENGDVLAVKKEIEFHLRLLATYLLKGDETLSDWGQVGQKRINLFSAVTGMITLAYIRNQIYALQDMSTGAANAFRVAADRILGSALNLQPQDDRSRNLLHSVLPPYCSNNIDSQQNSGYRLTAKWQVVEGKLVRQWRFDAPEHTETLVWTQSVT
jgi:glutathione S-transferase